MPFLLLEQLFLLMIEKSRRGQTLPIAISSMLLHELTHWTGCAKRCDREFGKRFGDDAYAVEELVAELGAAFLCAQSLREIRRGDKPASAPLSSKGT